MELRRDTIDGVRLEAIIDGKNLVALVARPDDGRLWTGDTVTATVMRYAEAQKSFFLKAGDVEVLLPEKAKTKCHPGEAVTITIERPATPDKHARAVLGGISFAPEYPDAKPSDKNLEDFDETIQKLQESNVECGKGANIVIDEAAAATGVDINAAAPDLSALEVNRLAATVIFRHMRLRNLQGQILIDFLRMREQEDKVALMAHLQALMTADPRPVHLYGFTR